jgi:hypothetical protein
VSRLPRQAAFIVDRGDVKGLPWDIRLLVPPFAHFGLGEGESPDPTPIMKVTGKIKGLKV